MDPSGTPIRDCAAVWQHLSAFFGEALPTRITIEKENEGTSHFDPGRNLVYISKTSLQGQGVAAPSSECAVVAHETAHVALAKLTDGASTMEAFRFLDEGLATIIQERVDGTIARYKRAALGLAARRLSIGSVKLTDVQVWSKYFGDPGVKADYRAYEVGSAFVFFVEDTWGEGALRRLFRDLAKTKSLDASVGNIHGRTLDETEREWESYLRSVEVHVPTIAEMVPRNGATAVPRDLGEIRVTFDTDMSPVICVSTNCNDGICYDHAYWKDARTLAIKLDEPLASSRAYSLSLGSPNQCALTSADGIEVPVVKWEFRTND